MDIANAINIGLTIIGGATVLLNIVAPLTKWKGDDKILSFLKQFLEYISLNVNDKGDTKLEIVVSRK